MKEKIIEIIANYKGIDAAEIDSAKPFSEIGLDSLDVAELVMQIEDECGVEIERSPEYNNIDKLVEYIENKQNG